MLARLGRMADRLLEVAAVLVVLAMLGSVFFGVVFRALNRPLAWSDELGTYLLVWTGFIGWILAGNHNSHIRILVLLDRLRGRVRAAAEVAIQLLILLFGAILLFRSFGLIQRNLDVMWVSLPLSVALVYVPLPIAGFAVTCQSLVAIARAVRGEVDEPPEGLPL